VRVERRQHAFKKENLIIHGTQIGGCLIRTLQATISLVVSSNSSTVILFLYFFFGFTGLYLVCVGFCTIMVIWWDAVTMPITKSQFLVPYMLLFTCMSLAAGFFAVFDEEDAFFWNTILSLTSLGYDTTVSIVCAILLVHLFITSKNVRGTAQTLALLKMPFILCSFPLFGNTVAITLVIFLLKFLEPRDAYFVQTVSIQMMVTTFTVTYYFSRINHASHEQHKPTLRTVNKISLSLSLSPSSSPLQTSSDLSLPSTLRAQGPTPTSVTVVCEEAHAK